jgi:hypothetical protein
MGQTTYQLAQDFATIHCMLNNKRIQSASHNLASSPSPQQPQRALLADYTWHNAPRGVSPETKAGGYGYGQQW